MNTNGGMCETGNDFDNDGKADILLRNYASGQNWMHLMNGTALSASLPVNILADVNWKIVATNDFNGDGRTDIYLRHSLTGQNRMYLMNSNNITLSAAVSTISNIDYKVVGSGDF